MKLWEKGYDLDTLIEEYTVGNDPEIDQRLIKFDCIASIAHAKTLCKAGFLTKEETDKLAAELNNIIQLDKKGEFKIERSDEDCHTAIEKHLITILGDIGKKIHTARSRNDQVMVAVRLYLKECLNNISILCNKFINETEVLQNKTGDVEFSGFTHTRKAMPCSFKLWSSAFADSMIDNLKLLNTSYELIDQSPLGSGAGFGLPLDLPKEYTAELLDFKKVQENPVYVQLSRGKFESTIVHLFSKIMFDLNRLAQDLIIFSMPEFGFFILPREFCTGSSIMPQKVNPDVLELLRANYHRVLSYEFSLSTINSNLITGYHRDLQFTKEPVFNAFDITEKSLAIIIHVYKKLSIDKIRCKQSLTDEIYATEKAYNLVKQGIPFRDAYKKIAETN